MIDRYTLPEMEILWSAESKFQHWLKVELAILWARQRLGDITQYEYDVISQNASFTVARIKELDALYDHDMIAFIETIKESLRRAELSECVIDLFHQRHSSYDIEDPAVMLQLLQAGTLILDKLRNLHTTLLRKVEEHKKSLMIARTHGQFAEPTTFGHLLLVYAECIKRAIQDITDVRETNLAVGKMSGAIGSYAGLKPQEEILACRHLGLKPAVVATQILQRDRHARFMAALTTASGSIEQMATTFWIMMHSRVRELQEPRKAKQRGSSAMPFKINPILVERLMGLPRVMRGYLSAAQENIRVLEFRDISQSSVERIIFPDATTLLHYMADRATKLIDGLVVFKDNMAINLERTLGVWAGQRIRYALVENAISDNDAYLFIQRTCFEAVDTKKHLSLVLLDARISENDSRTAPEILGAERIVQLFDVENYIQPGLETIFSRF